MTSSSATLVMIYKLYGITYTVHLYCIIVKHYKL